MKKMFLVCAGLFVIVSVLHAGGQELNWNYSVTQSYPPKVAKKITPKDLAEKISRINKFEADTDWTHFGCDRAMTEYTELQTAYPNRFEVYANIPTCRVGHQLTKSVEDFMQGKDPADLKQQLSILKTFIGELEAHYATAISYFDRATKANSQPELWEAYLNVSFSHDMMLFMVKNSMAGVLARASSKKEASELLNNWLKGLKEGAVHFDKLIGIAKHLNELFPKDARYKGMLGSMITGKVVLTLASQMQEEASKLPKGKVLDTKTFMARYVKDNATLIYESKSLLQPICQSSLYAQACKDLEILKVLETSPTK